MRERDRLGPLGRIEAGSSEADGNLAQMQLAGSSGLAGVQLAARSHRCMLVRTSLTGPERRQAQPLRLRIPVKRTSHLS